MHIKHLLVNAVVIVYRDLGQIGFFETGVDEEYTSLSVPKGTSTLTEFSVFWLVPDQNYYVEVYLGDPTDPASQKYSEFIEKAYWTSKTFLLNGEAVLF